jgi:hypothetical protein
LVGSSVCAPSELQRRDRPTAIVQRHTLWHTSSNKQQREHRANGHREQLKRRRDPASHTGERHRNINKPRNNTAVPSENRVWGGRVKAG